MTIQQTITDIPEESIEEVFRDFELENALVIKKKQPDGTWSVIVSPYGLVTSGHSNYLTDSIIQSAQISGSDLENSTSGKRHTFFSLEDGSNYWSRFGGIVGGVMLGISFSQILSIILANSSSTAEIISATIPGIVGAFFIARQLPKK